jgi:hypothetical protein
LRGWPELLGCARVATTEQNADLQRDALTRAGGADERAAAGPERSLGLGVPGVRAAAGRYRDRGALRAELAVRWLIAEAGGLVARGFCHDCVPAEPVSEVACAYCGDGPLLAGPLAGVDPAADPAVARWLGAEGRQLEPVLICPACRRAFVRTSSW